MSEYKIITKKDYYKNKHKYLNMIEQLFKNDDSKIANLKEISEHLEFIFNENQDNDSMLILNIECEKIISMINLLQYNNVDNFWCLFSLFTLKSERKKGYGEQILRYGINEVKKKNAKLLISGIEKGNKESIRLHEKVGFTFSGKMWDELADGFPENHLGYIIEF